MVACEIHPLNNLRVLKYLVHQMGASDEAKNGWYAHWVRSGLEAFERQLALLDAERKASGLAPSTFCWGTRPRWPNAAWSADLQRPALQCESRCAAAPDGRGERCNACRLSSRPILRPVRMQSEGRHERDL
jgi:glutathione S-transferase